MSRSELSSIRAISTPGWARWNAARASNSGVTVQPVTMPTTSRPRISPVTSSTACRTASHGCEHGAGVLERRRSGGCQGGRTARPVDEGRAEIVFELRIWALTPDWLMCTRSAARVKFASSATATKYSSCLSSITRDSSYE